jgi:hypothetical protein
MNREYECAPRSSGWWTSACLLALALSVRLCAAANPEATHTPPPQAPLVGGHAGQSTFAAFNSAVGRPRVLAMFSPT